MIRVLHIVDSLDMGGIQTFLLNVYRNIDREKIKFDILVFREHKQVLEDENIGEQIKINFGDKVILVIESHLKLFLKSIKNIRLFIIMQVH